MGMTLNDIGKALWKALSAMVEKPLNFAPFGHARFAHLFVLYD